MPFCRSTEKVSTIPGGGIFDDRWGGTTVTDTAVYVHILNIPPDKKIDLPLYSGKVVAARYLNDNGKTAFVQSGADVSLMDISDKHGEPDLIVKLTLQ